MENVEIIRKIENLTGRLLVIQDRFCEVLVESDGEGTDEQVQNISGAVSWANTSMYTLSLMRIQIMLHGTKSLSQLLPEGQKDTLTIQDVQEVIQSIENQVVDIEADIQQIDDDIE